MLVVNSIVDVMMNVIVYLCLFLCRLGVMNV